MDKVGTLVPVLGNCLTQLPIVLVWVVGAILAIARWQRHPRVSALMLAALAIFFVESVVGAYTSVWLPVAMLERSIDAARIGLILAAVRLVWCA